MLLKNKVVLLKQEIVLDNIDGAMSIYNYFIEDIKSMHLDTKLFKATVYLFHPDISPTGRIMSDPVDGIYLKIIHLA